MLIGADVDRRPDRPRPARSCGPARPKGPCDVYAAASAPCVAAHSTTRALYASYKRPALPGPASVRRQDLGHRRRPAGGVARARMQGGYANAACTRTRSAPTRIAGSPPSTTNPPSTTISSMRRAADSAARRWAGSTISRSPTWRRSRSWATRPTASSSRRAWASPERRERHRRSMTRRRGSTGSSTAITTTPACCFDYGNAETD
jgi:hypothetical protein